MKPTTSTIVRVGLLIVALINLALQMFGIVPEDVVGDSSFYEAGSYILTAVVAIVNMWKNNSFTKEAIEADAYMAQLKLENKTGTSSTAATTDAATTSSENTESNE